MMRIKDVSKKYGNKIALDRVSFQLPETGLVAINGENEEGKEALFKLLGGLERPDSGSIIFDNLVLSCKTERELADFRSKYVSFVFKDDNLFENKTVEENLKVFETHSVFDKVVTMFKLEPLLDKPVSSLTLEQKSYVSIARAMSKNSKIFLAQELTEDISLELKRSYLLMLKSLSQTRLVIVVSREDYEIDEYADVFIEVDRNSPIHVNYFKNIQNKNEIPPFQEKIADFRHITKAIFSEWKLLVSSSLFAVFALGALLLSLSILSFDGVDYQVYTMKENGDDFFAIYPDKKYIDEEEFLELEQLDAFEKPIRLGYRVGGVEYAYHRFAFDEKSAQFSDEHYRVMPTNYTFFELIDGDNIDIGKTPAMGHEIVINSYLADAIVALGVKDSSGEYYRPENYEALVNDKRKIALMDKYVVISGIKKVHLSSPGTLFDNYEDVVENEGGHIYVSSDFFEEFKASNELDPKLIFSYDNEEDVKKSIAFDKLKAFEESVILEDETEVNTLGLQELIIRQEDIESFGIYKDTAVGSKVNLYVRDAEGSIIETMTFTVRGITKDDTIYYNAQTLAKYNWSGQSVDKAVVHATSEQMMRTLLEIDFTSEKYPYMVKTNYTRIIDLLERDTKIVGSTVGFLSGALFLFVVTTLARHIFSTIEDKRNNLGLLKALGDDNRRICLSYVLHVFVSSVGICLVSLGVAFAVSHAINSYLINSTILKGNIVLIESSSVFKVFLAILFMDFLTSLVIYKKIVQINCS